MDTLHQLNDIARPLLPYTIAFNGIMFGHQLAKGSRWGAVWFCFWMLACLVAA